MDKLYDFTFKGMKTSTMKTMHKFLKLTNIVLIILILVVILINYSVVLYKSYEYNKYFKAIKAQEIEAYVCTKYGDFSGMSKNGNERQEFCEWVLIFNYYMEKNPKIITETVDNLMLEDEILDKVSQLTSFKDDYERMELMSEEQNKEYLRICKELENMEFTLKEAQMMSKIRQRYRYLKSSWDDLRLSLERK